MQSETHAYTRITLKKTQGILSIVVLPPYLTLYFIAFQGCPPFFFFKATDVNIASL